MENTLTGGAGTAASRGQSALQNGSLASKIKLALLWLAVGLPMIWGAVQALKDIGSLPL